VAKYISNAVGIQHEVNGLRKWANNQEKDDEKSTDDEVEKMLLTICEQVGINGQNLIRHSETLQKAAKAVMSYIKLIKGCRP